jgi:predicted nucleic acid-binding Zn ribbon protein
MESQDEVNTVFHLIKVPTEDELEFWIQQFKGEGFYETDYKEKPKEKNE